MAASVELLSGELRLLVYPEVGGSIGAFQLRREEAVQHLMRPAATAEISSSGALAMSSFPLVPYSNRVLGGRFEFGGRLVRQSPNMLPHEHPLHGHAWRAPFRVTYLERSRLVLEYEHAPGEWPWRYSAVQSFALTDNSLSLTLSVENRSAEPMPAGLGLHPYFECNELTTLQANLPLIWRVQDFVPMALEAVTRGSDFRRPTKVCETSLDHCFEGWDGRAEIHWPDRGVRLRISSDTVCERAVIYTPKGASFFCFEPVSHANDAFNSASRGDRKTGLRVLAPGEKLATTTVFSVDS